MFDRAIDTADLAFVGRVIPPRVSEADVLDALSLLGDVLSEVSRGVLPAELLTDRLDALSRRLSAVLHRAGDLRIEEFQGHFLVHDAPLSLEAQDLPFVRGLSFFLVSRNVRAITFSPGLDAGELGELVRLLALPETSDLAVPLEEMLRRAASHVAVEPQVFRASGSAFEDVLAAFSFARPSADPIPADDVDGLTGEPDEIAIRAIAELVERGGEEFVDEADAAFDFEVVEDLPVESGASAETEQSDGDALLDEADSAEPEPSIEFTRLDEPMRAGEPGDEADMVALADLDDEGEQLLSDLEFDEQALRESFDDDPAPIPSRTVAAKDGGEVSTFDDGMGVPIEFHAEPVDRGAWDVVDLAEPAPTSGDVTFVIRVGRFALAGATVKVRDVEVVARKTRGEDGAVFDLAPGEYAVEIIYEDFRVERRVTIGRGKQRIEIDLQSIFDY
jgi:hypothetical protein